MHSLPFFNLFFRSPLKKEILPHIIINNIVNTIHNKLNSFSLKAESLLLRRSNILFFRVKRTENKIKSFSFSKDAISPSTNKLEDFFFIKNSITIYPILYFLLYRIHVYHVVIADVLQQKLCDDLIV